MLNPFEAQTAQQGLAQQQLMATLADINNPLSTLATPTISQATPPRFSFQANNLGQGLENGINNFLQGRAYRQNLDIRNNYLAERQRAIEENRAAKEQNAINTAKRLQLGNDLIREQYGDTLANYDLATQGGLQAQAGKGLLDNELTLMGKRTAPLAEAQGAYQARPLTARITRENSQDATINQIEGMQDKIDYIAAATGFDLLSANVNEQEVPPRVRALADNLGIKYNDVIDARKRRAELSNAETGAAINDIKLQAAPTLTQQQIEKNQVDLAVNKIALQFKPDQLKEELRAKQLGNTKLGNELDRIDAAQKVFEEWQRKVASGEAIDPKDIATVQQTITFLTKLDPNIDATVKTLVNPKAGQALKTNKIYKEIKKPSTSGGIGGIDLGPTKIMDLKRADDQRLKGYSQQVNKFNKNADSAIAQAQGQLKLADELEAKIRKAMGY